MWPEEGCVASVHSLASHQAKEQSIHSQSSTHMLRYAFFISSTGRKFKWGSPPGREISPGSCSSSGDSGHLLLQEMRVGNHLIGRSSFLLQ